MNRFTITLMILISGVVSSMAQSSMQCCKAPSATAAFASLASDINFRNAHESPEALVYPEKGSMIKFPTADGKTGAAYYIPAASKSNNYILVFHEWWGLNEWIKKQSDLFSDSIKNANVIAVDLYEGQVATNSDEAGKLMQALDQTRAMNIVKGAISYMGANAKIATVGWCFGGGWSLQGALAAGKNEAGCVMYYGMPESDVNKLKTLNSDVLFIWAKQDQWINEKVKDDFVKNMQAAGKKLTVKEYDADHAFANPSNPHHNKEAAEDAQHWTLAYFRSHLK